MDAEILCFAVLVEVCNGVLDAGRSILTLILWSCGSLTAHVLMLVLIFVVTLFILLQLLLPLLLPFPVLLLLLEFLGDIVVVLGGIHA